MKNSSIQTNHLSNNYRFTGKHGFALNSSLLIMSLLSLIAFGICSLFRISTGSSDLEAVRVETEARMAFYIAIGQLLKKLVPDQIISAEASILDSSTTPWIALSDTTQTDTNKECGRSYKIMSLPWLSKTEIKTL